MHICNWLTAEWILKSTNYKRLLQLRFNISILISKIEGTQWIDHGERDQIERSLRVCRKIEYQKSSQRSEKNLDFQESWSWRKSHWRSNEARDVRAATDWDWFLIDQVFLNSIFILFFLLYFFFEFLSSCLSADVQSSVCTRFELGEAVNQLLKLCISEKVVNQWMVSYVAQRIASCEAQPVWLLVLQQNFVNKSCEKI